jgi:hypothetical protein
MILLLLVIVQSILIQIVEKDSDALLHHAAFQVVSWERLFIHNIWGLAVVSDWYTINNLTESDF